MSAVEVTDAGPGRLSSEDVAGAVAAPKLLRRLLRRPVAVFCLAYLALLVSIAIVAPLLLPHVADQQAGDLLTTRLGPSAEHPLGTDSLGRDVLERLLVGTRVTLLGVAEGLAVALVLGIPFGLAAGFLGGRVDRAVTWLADLSFSMPSIIIVIIVLSVFTDSMLAAMCTFGVLSAPGLMRVVRSATLPVRNELYIDAAEVAGLSRAYIITRHVLPRVAGPTIVYASLIAAATLLIQCGLGFLDLVVPAPAPSWGGMLADGAESVELQPWLIWPPGVAITLTVLALGLLGDAVRDAGAESWSRSAHRRRSRPVRVREAPPAALDRPAVSPDHGALLSVADLVVALDRPGGLVPLVDEVGFSIGPGETVGLVGESGCGKTITANAVLGLLPPGVSIQAGRIDFMGRDLVPLPERELRRIRGSEVALISQDHMVSLDPSFRVGSQLAEAVRTHHRVSRGAAHARVVELLRSVRLPDPESVARRYPHELSGGMAQRVAIARALAGEPQLLIADEPTTALDVTVQAEILELLRELQRDRRMAILLVTHDWGVVADICDRAVVMYAGQVVERAGLLETFRTPLHPYTEALLASNPSNATAGRGLPTIPGAVPQPGTWPPGCHFHPRCRYATVECERVAVQLEQPAPGRATRCLHYTELRHG